MNTPSKFGRMASLFKSNRNQAVRIPKEFEFPEGVKNVYIRKHERGLAIIAVNDFWDDFFARPGIEIEEPPELAYETRETF